MAASVRDLKRGTNPTGPQLPSGTYEDALTWVGRRSQPVPGDGPVDWPMIRWFASLLRDPNPSYWDEGWATARWGGIPSPPALLLTWIMPLPWRPDRAHGAERTTRVFAERVPLPGSTLINVGMETVHHRPVLVGEHLSLTEAVVSVSPEKQTRLGRGHFLVTSGTFTADDGQVVAEHSNTMLRFEPEHSEGPGNDHSTPASGPPPGGKILEVTAATVAGLAFGTRDVFPGHHDPAYARLQGESGIYLNTMSILGFLDSIALDHVGHEAFVARRSMQMLRPVCAGTRLQGVARVEGRRESGDSQLTDVVTEGWFDGTLCCCATATLAHGA